jgi:hypothetical protein
MAPTGQVFFHLAINGYFIFYLAKKTVASFNIRFSIFRRLTCAEGTSFYLLWREFANTPKILAAAPLSSGQSCWD